jgi:hypothetical protein
MADLKFAFKCLHGWYDCKPDDIGLALQQGATRGCNTRLSVPRANNSAVKAFYKYRLPSQWNTLPLTILSLSSFKTFSSAVFNYFSSVE